MTDKPATLHKRSRDEIRANLLKSRPQEKRIVRFFEEDIEIRQPTLDDIIKAAYATSADDDTSKVAVISILVKYSYIPGTDERVFDETDVDVLKQLPFGPDFARLMQAYQELTDVNFQRPKTG